MSLGRGALAALALVAVVPFRASATEPMTCADYIAPVCAEVTKWCRFSQDATGGRLYCNLGN